MARLRPMMFIFVIAMFILPRESRSEDRALPFDAIIGDYKISVTSQEGLLVKHNKLQKQFSTTGFPFLHSSCGEWSATQTNGNYEVTDTPRNKTTLQTLASATKQSSDAVVLHGVLGYKGASTCLPVEYTMTISVIDGVSDRLAFQVSAVVTNTTENMVTEKPNRIFLQWKAPKGESYHGFGHQYSVWNLRGRRVPIITTEQGIGRGLQPLTLALNKFGAGAGGNWHTTYSATPVFVTNSLWGMIIHNTEPAVFDLDSESKNVSEVSVVNSGDSANNEVWDSANKDFAETAIKKPVLLLSGELLFATTPLGAIKAISDVTGRMQPLPKWASGSGAVVGYEGGTQAVRDMWKLLQGAGVPVSAFWLQDWSGKRVTPFGTRLWWNWEIDTNFYPGWDNFLSELSSNQVKVLIYINPYLANNVASKSTGFKRNLFAEAARHGYLVRNSTGQPYILTSAGRDFSFGTIDLTNPDALDWTVALIRCNMLRVGGGCGPGNSTLTGPSPYSAYGWMADFAEYIPFDAKLYAGEPSAVHNTFPKLWAEANRRAVEGVGFTGESRAVFFSRSAALGSPGASTLFWMGDQLTTFDMFDGMHSAMLGMLSGGVVGHSLSHSDIGGYTMVQECLGNGKKICFKIVRSKELLLRWMEMSAFSDVMFRTHLGNKPNASAQIYSDNETLSHFSTFAKVHAALYPYRVKLMAQAASTGAPVTRHPWLHYPLDSTAAALTSQFMLGPDLMVAPAFGERVKEVTVYLPGHTDQWVYWDDPHTSLPGGEHHTVSSPIGRPAVFARKAATVLDPGVWTEVTELLRQL